MLKKILLLCVLIAPVLWAEDVQPTDERLARLKWEEDQRQDEYANSLRRRDWLKDRLILGPGLGSKYSMMGKEGFGFGVAAEYITRWHVAPFLSYGIAFKRTDPSFDTLSLAGGAGGRVGLSYYFFPKSPMHLALSASYGSVYFDHEQKADVDGLRKIIQCKGWEGDLAISYLTNEWYFLNFVAGAYYVGKKMPGTTNKSTGIDDTGKETGLTMGAKKIPDYGLVFGAGIGFALPDMFPDDTEKRRRDREKTR